MRNRQRAREESRLRAALAALQTQATGDAEQVQAAHHTLQELLAEQARLAQQEGGASLRIAPGSAQSGKLTPVATLEASLDVTQQQAQQQQRQEAYRTKPAQVPQAAQQWHQQAGAGLYTVQAKQKAHAQQPKQLSKAQQARRTKRAQQAAHPQHAQQAVLPQHAQQAKQTKHAQHAAAPQQAQQLQVLQQAWQTQQAWLAKQAQHAQQAKPTQQMQVQQTQQWWRPLQARNSIPAQPQPRASPALATPSQDYACYAYPAANALQSSQPGADHALISHQTAAAARAVWRHLPSAAQSAIGSQQGMTESGSPRPDGHLQGLPHTAPETAGTRASCMPQPSLFTKPTTPTHESPWQRAMAVVPSSQFSSLTATHATAPKPNSYGAQAMLQQRMLHPLLQQVPQPDGRVAGRLLALPNTATAHPQAMLRAATAQSSSPAVARHACPGATVQQSAVQHHGMTSDYSSVLAQMSASDLPTSVATLLSQQHGAGLEHSTPLRPSTQSFSQPPVAHAGPLWAPQSAIACLQSSAGLPLDSRSSSSALGGHGFEGSRQLNSRMAASTTGARMAPSPSSPYNACEASRPPDNSNVTGSDMSSRTKKPLTPQCNTAMSPAVHMIVDTLDKSSSAGASKPVLPLSLAQMYAKQSGSVSLY